MCRMPEVQRQIDFPSMFSVGYCASVSVFWPQCLPPFFFKKKSDFLQHFVAPPSSSLGSCLFSIIYFIVCKRHLFTGGVFLNQFQTLLTDTLLKCLFQFGPVYCDSVRVCDSCHVCDGLETGNNGYESHVL